MKLTIFLILISILIIGCVTTQKQIPDSQKIPYTYDQIDTKLLLCQPFNDKECNTYVEGINGKYVNWSGIVSDIKDSTVYVQLPSNHRFLKKVSLYDVATFANLKIGQRIIFQGKINLNCNLGCFNAWTKLKEIELRDARIQVEST